METPASIKINLTHLCVLKKDSNKDEIRLDFEPLVDPIKDDFALVEKLYSTSDSTATDLLSFVNANSKLKCLLSAFEFCETLSLPWSNGIYEKSLNFETIQHGYSKSIELLQREKEEAYRDLRERHLAFCLWKTYQLCESKLEDSVLAYSHRRPGWSNPPYTLGEKFVLEIKTNFGYGAASYFYARIIYKGTPIVPYSDWVLYAYANAYEIVNYSAKFPLRNESWIDAFNFIVEAYNLSRTDEVGFIQKYIITECEKLVSGLENILSEKKFSFLDLRQFKNANETNLDRLERFADNGTRINFIYNQWRQFFIDKQYEGRSLISFRGMKISGAVSFIQSILGLKEILDSANFVSRIEQCCKSIDPIIKTELGLIHGDLLVLSKKLNNISPRYNYLVQKNLWHNKRKDDLLSSLLNNSKGAGISVDFVEQQYITYNKGYSNFKLEYQAVENEYLTCASKIKGLEDLKKQFEGYLQSINFYFNVS